MKKISNADLGRLSPKAFAGARKLPLAVVLDNVRSAQNVGSFFRTCDAFGVSKLALCGITAVPPSREIHKTALGAEDTVAWSYFSSTAEALEALRDEGYTLVAVEQVDEAVPLPDFDFVGDGHRKCALVFGNEVEGVDAELLPSCHTAIEIPQVGTKHSLNVSVAGGVVLWEAFRQLAPRIL